MQVKVINGMAVMLIKQSPTKSVWCKYELYYSIKDDTIEISMHSNTIHISPRKKAPYINEGFSKGSSI